jgi:putative membrane protein
MRVIRWLIGGVIFLVLLLVALQNADPVTLRFFNVWSYEAPLVFVLLLAFAAGVGCGLLAGAVRVARLSRQLARMRRDHAAARRVPPAPHGATPGTAPASGPGFEPPTDAF